MWLWHLTYVDMVAVCGSSPHVRTILFGHLQRQITPLRLFCAITPPDTSLYRRAVGFPLDVGIAPERGRGT